MEQQEKVNVAKEVGNALVDVGYSKLWHGPRVRMSFFTKAARLLNQRGIKHPKGKEFWTGRDIDNNTWR